jgi:TonB family protein
MSRSRSVSTLRSMQDKTFLLAVLLLASGPLLQARNNSADQQLLDSILEKHDFLPAAPAPFVLDAEFTGYGNAPMRGHFRMRWQSKDHWWTRVDMGPVQHIRMRNGEMEYTVRNLDFTPIQITDLFSLFDFITNERPIRARKLIERTEAGIAMQCVQARIAGSSEHELEFCTDPITHDLLKESWSEAPGQSRTQRFSDYVEVNGVRYPSKLDMYNNNSKLISAHVVQFQSMVFDPALLNPPERAIVRRKCADLREPVPMKRGSIDLGLHLGLNSQSVLALTILTDGSVGEVHVVQSGGSFLDSPALAALKNWKFRPAMCGSDPVVADTTIEVNYSIPN